MLQRFSEEADERAERRTRELEERLGRSTRSGGSRRAERS